MNDECARVCHADIAQYIDTEQILKQDATKQGKEEEEAATSDPSLNITGIWSRANQVSTCQFTPALPMLIPIFFQFATDISGAPYCC